MEPTKKVHPDFDKIFNLECIHDMVENYTNFIGYRQGLVFVKYF